MSYSQTLLSLGAITIFMYMALNINKSYIIASKQTVDHQQELDAINFGNSVSELMYSQTRSYSSLDANYGDLNDVTNPSKRLDFTTVLGWELSATIELSAEQEVLQGVNGRIATITVYTWQGGVPVQKTQHLAPIIAL